MVSDKGELRQGQTNKNGVSGQDLILTRGIMYPWKI